MKKIIKRMWHWEWVHEDRKEFITLGIEMTILFIIFLFYILGKRYLFAGNRILRALPVPFLALLGLDSATEMGNISFYLMYILLIFNLWNIWHYGKHMIHIVDRDEISGNIYTICGQWFSRTQIAWSKWGFNILWIIVQQSLLYIWTILWMLAGSTNNFQKIHYLSQLSISWSVNICVMILFASICFFYAVFPKRNLKKTISHFPNMLFWTLFIAGNLYKLKDILLFLLEYLEGDFEKFIPAFKWLDQLGQIMPLSLINPFVNTEPIQLLLQLIIYLCFCITTTTLGVTFYYKREFLG